MEATPATQTAVPTERQITVSGLRTRMLETGSPDAREAVVFVHYLGLDLAKAQEQVFPSAPLVIIRDSGRWPFVDNPEEVASHVLPFLRERTTAPKET